MKLLEVQRAEREQTRHVPGEVGLWVFILCDVILFSVFFATFLYYRRQSSDLFAASQSHLNQLFGVFNTLFMLSSSWCVAMAVRAARRNMNPVTPILFMLAFICGLGFSVLKIFEYREKISAGITLSTNDFFMFYYMFTGIHFMHVIIGMAVLALLVKYSWSGNYDNAKILNLESGASFWHVVDLLWIVLFALFYLIK